MAPKVTKRNLLEETAQKMTAIVQQALDQLPPAERARSLKTYLSKGSIKTSSSSVVPCETRSKRPASEHVRVFRVTARSR
jgi:hypothetical protein